MRVRNFVLLIVLVASCHGSAQEPRVYRDQIHPHWFHHGDRFWYRVRLRDNRHEFVMVDAVAGRRQPAFDHRRIAEMMAQTLEHSVDPFRLPVERLEYSEDASSVMLIGREGKWRLDIKTGQLQQTSTAEKTSAGAMFFLPPRRSEDAGGETELVIENRMPFDIELVWIDRDGRPVSYGRIAKGASKRQHTFIGHVWLLRGPDGQPLACFEAGGSQHRIKVSPDALKNVRQQLESGEKSDRPPRDAPSRRPPAADVSPNGQWTAFCREENLWLRDSSGDEVALTTDATADRTFRRDVSRARMVSMQYTAQDPPADSVDVRWSPDSKFLVAFQTKKVPEQYVYYLDVAPREQFRPVLNRYPYARPGDEIPVSRPRLFRVADRNETEISSELMHLPFDLKFLRWAEHSSGFWILYNERGHQNLRVLFVSCENGSVTPVVEEHSDTFIHYSSPGKLVTTWLDDKQLLWASERSGWNHLYLCDARRAAPPQAVTQGAWNVRRIEHIDRLTGTIWFYAVGIAENQDPYHEHFCRVQADGSAFVRLTDGDGTHRVRFSPDKRFLVDRFSRVDLPPVHELRDARDGRLICQLEQADASEITAAGRLPVRFHAKGRDGVTDIWGVIHFPRQYQAGVKYPIVESIYAGPHDHHVPKAFRTRYRQQELTDRGMFVVQIDGMGTAWRSKAFHDVCYKNLKDAGFRDRIAWIKAAAEKYPAMDLRRVGIYGGSAGGQNAVAALLWHSAFYRVAVADCGCHDNRMDKLWWNEQWMGYPVDEHYVHCSNVSNAYRLQGRLLLIVGAKDRNVDPASTLQVVDQLIKAGKDFEFLCVPSAGHGAAETAYGRRRRAEFLATHLKAESLPASEAETHTR